MRAATRTGTNVRTRRVREGVGALGVRVALLVFWGTAAVLTRWCTRPQQGGGESVRHKA
ncbi:hypothetical protein GA0115254_106725 [Streptomyces sp. Ncost-T10-10d]|nr:hypothetical protein GA0115254_106725 [Streptomyces sp. Ncost-T10-10d]